MIHGNVVYKCRVYDLVSRGCFRVFFSRDFLEFRVYEWHWMHTINGCINNVSIATLKSQIGQVFIKVDEK